MNKLFNRVPEITLFFWVIKIMATTVGETAADFLSFTMKLGLINTSWVMSGLLVFGNRLTDAPVPARNFMFAV